jgi:hypothetical protein
MEFTIYRDLASIAFVRCTTPIPGTRIRAEGVSFSVGRAIAKCRSERIESLLQLSHPLCHQILGIAAHPVATASSENAWNEALETLFLERLRHVPIIYGLNFRLLGVKMVVGRLNDRFIALAFFHHRKTPTATQAVGRNPFGVLLKAWTEVRNLRLYNPPAVALPTYTKANRILANDQFSRITTSFSLRTNTVNTDSLQKFQSKEDFHYITFFIQEAQS